MLGFGGLAVLIFIPVRAPVVGIGGANPFGDFIQSIHNEGSKIARIGRRCVIQRLTDLRDVGMTVGGITADHSLAVSCRDENIAPVGQRVVGGQRLECIAGLLARKSGEALDKVICPSGCLRLARPEGASD